MRAPHFLSLLCAERGHEKVSPVVHWARAHVQIQLEVGNKSFDLVARRLAETRATQQLEQRACIFLVLVGSELGRLRAGWNRWLSAHGERRSDLRCGWSAHGELRSGSNDGLSARRELRSGLSNRLSAHARVRSSLLVRLSAHSRKRSGLNGWVSAHGQVRSNFTSTVSARGVERSDLSDRLHGSSL